MAEKLEKTEASRPCAISGSSEAVVVATKAREGHSLRNIISTHSGLVYVDPLHIEDLAQYYREDYRVSYKNAFVPKRKHIHRAGRVARNRLGHAKGKIRKGLKCLDIGAGGGEWVYLMNKLGCEGHGIEPNQGYGSFAKDQYGVDVFLGMYQEAQHERGSFDLVTLFQVLEHLAEPVEDLRRMGEFLKPGGLFVIEVPDILFAGMQFDHKWHDGHLYGFDALTLEAVAAKAGLKKVALDVIPGNLYGVFEKSEEEVEGPDLSTHFNEAWQALQQGRSRYWSMPRTYLKVPRRLLHRSREYLEARKLDQPRQILDAVYEGVGA
ncbi:MAG: class I SAM-dependent methyltransferase [Verrucomicrobiota bacterium]